MQALLAKIEMKSFATRDEQEVAGYAQVMELLFGSWEHIVFNENHIMQIHRDLLAYSSKDERHRGQYKTHENRVAAFDEQGHEIATIFQTALPLDTPRLMRELVDWVRYMRSSQSLHPLLKVSSSKTSRLTTLRCGKRKARSAPTHQTGNWGPVIGVRFQLISAVAPAHLGAVLA